MKYLPKDGRAEQMHALKAIAQTYTYLADEQGHLITGKIKDAVEFSFFFLAAYRDDVITQYRVDAGEVMTLALEAVSEPFHLIDEVIV